MKDDRILGLAEMMNAYGVTHKDDECLKKCVDAINAGKLIYSKNNVIT